MTDIFEFINPRPDNQSEKWRAIERSLELATQAESLREHSRRLRATSRQIREESTRLTREKLLKLNAD